jgi:hypothetical protein
MVVKDHFQFSILLIRELILYLFDTLNFVFKFYLKIQNLPKAHLFPNWQTPSKI